MNWIHITAAALLCLALTPGCSSETEDKKPLNNSAVDASHNEDDVGSSDTSDGGNEEPDAAENNVNDQDVDEIGDIDEQDIDETDVDKQDPEKTHTLLILHQQNPPYLDRFVERQTQIDALPFDGTTFRIPASFDIHSPTAVSVERLREEFAPYAQLQMTHVTSHWLIIYASPAGPITDYQTVVDNFTNLAQVAGEAGIAGIFYDTEEYLGDTWSLDVLGPDRPEQDVLAETRARGHAMALAIAERWPEAQILITLGPWIAEPLSAAAPYLGEACVHDNGLVYDIAWANQGMGAFTVGLALGSLESSLTFIDGAEIYTQRTLADWQRSYDWIKQGFATHSALVPAASKAAYAQQVEVAQAPYDFPGTYRCKGPTTVADWQLDIENALKTSDSIAWAYSERFEWVGNLYSGKPAPPQDWLEATRQGKAAGQAP